MSNLNLVHLNGLRALEAVARLGSLQAAADELGVSIGAVSQQVIKAEAQLGHPVFQRLSKGMVALEGARPMLARLTDGFRSLSEAVAIGRPRDEKLLTISVAPVFAARFLVHRLDRFTALHPDIRLRIDATTALADFVADGVDLGIRVGAGKWPGVDAELLLPQLVFPVCTPALAKRLKEPADVLAMPTIVDGRALFSWDVWLRAAGLEGRQMEVRHVFNEASLCLDAVIAGEGVMLAFQTLAAYAMKEGKLVEPFAIRAATGAGHYFVTPEGMRQPPKVKAFHAWLTGELAELQPAPAIKA
ncbi:DNA-binding transcriptional regulator, LysR family [Rhizobium sp. NFR07]|uniref:LysR substrate-binding domain-containing protein n=1 Tax=Rhizobium sp. NFR07 TaxID=1566262 RepID=UPI0008E612CA|nr:LysR substrate-binding domain-containing protein [Rhizobium sp. NFR07]SFB04869.1 DNA-binding transcriptional regulator, LysR family [Rhizobium sp. NFR07]